MKSVKALPRYGSGRTERRKDRKTDGQRHNNIPPPMAGDNKEKILKWFQDLEEYITKEVGDAYLLHDPSRIYNADETGISICQTKTKQIR
ncbi:hypothetical protein DPMN_025962 [Dreissena polymorpha]|uniref:Uncharacterized protein n=1 Tax=Dreissena polymorpha TaxID=45954 RepID=A0A9D4LS06_DREPO|nr:hypothetical protein DPMN_025962 [Dreissena polymorpha]